MRVKEKIRAEKNKKNKKQVKRLKSIGPQPESADVFPKHQLGDTKHSKLICEAENVCLHQLLITKQRFAFTLLSIKSLSHFLVQTSVQLIRK